MVRDVTVLSRDTRSATGVFRLDGHRKPYYFYALRAPSGSYRVQRIVPTTTADASAAVTQALNADGENPPERSRGGVARHRRPGLPRRAAHLGGRPPFGAIN